MNKFLAVAGPIAVGKSTLARLLAQETGMHLIEEAVEGHPCLQEFYRAVKQMQDRPLQTHITEAHYQSLRTQIFFLWDRYNKHNTALSGCHAAGCIADRSIYEDPIFARILTERGEMNFTDFERIYMPHALELMRNLQEPDLMIILQASTETLMERKRLRDRNIESEISFAYMDNLNAEYKRWAKNYKGRRLIIDTDELDFTSATSADFKAFIGHLRKAVDLEIEENFAIH